MKTQFGLTAEKMICFCFIILIIWSAGCKKEPRNEVIFKKTDIALPPEAKKDPKDTTAFMNSTYNKDEMLFSYSITFPKALAPTKIYFYKGVPISPKDSVGGPYTSPVTGTTKTLQATEIDSLMGGKWKLYIKYPKGEINAQLVK